MAIDVYGVSDNRLATPIFRVSKKEVVLNLFHATDSHDLKW